MMGLTAVVTGGRGIGRAIAARRACNERVANIAILSRSLESAQAAAAEALALARTERGDNVDGDCALRAIGIGCDVGDSEDVAKR